MKYVLVLAVLVAAAVAQEASYGKPADGYFQYTNVKGHKEYEHGYNRGNEHHRRDHFQQNKDHRFRAKVSYDDANGSHGEHYFEYNHGPKGGYKPEPYKPQPAYAPEPYKPEPAPYKPSYS